VTKVYRHEPRVRKTKVGNYVLWRWSRSWLPCDEYGLNLPTHGGCTTEEEAWATVREVEQEQQKLRAMSSAREDYEMVFVKK